VTDPEKRISIDGLRKHPWYRLYQPENQNFNFHNEEIKVNPKLISKLELTLGFSPDSVERAVKNNKHNHLSATYYLLLKKYACQNFKVSQTAEPPKESLASEPDSDKSKAARPTSQ
jgi:5'-AMP-activated protein kinase catalytic alpha subunit